MRARGLCARERARSPKLTPSGGVPERSKGTRCKRVGSAFAGSNPAPATEAQHASACAHGERLRGFASTVFRRLARLHERLQLVADLAGDALYVPLAEGDQT